MGAATPDAAGTGGVYLIIVACFAGGLLCGIGLVTGRENGDIERAVLHRVVAIEANPLEAGVPNGIGYLGLNILPPTGDPHRIGGGGFRG